MAHAISYVSVGVGSVLHPDDQLPADLPALLMAKSASKKGSPKSKAPHRNAEKNITETKLF